MNSQCPKAARPSLPLHKDISSGFHKISINGSGPKGLLNRVEIQVVVFYQSTIRGIFTMIMGYLYMESGQTLQGSLSAVSNPIFATKYSLE